LSSTQSATSERTPSRLDMPLLGVLLIMLALWASAFPAISASLKHYTPGHVALGRYLVASLVLVVVAVLQRWPMPDKRDLPALALMGLLGFTIYNITLNFGQKVTPAGVASFLVNVAPVFVVIFAATFLRNGFAGAGQRRRVAAQPRCDTDCISSALRGRLQHFAEALPAQVWASASCGLLHLVRHLLYAGLRAGTAR
jgi:hypothetical protein